MKTPQKGNTKLKNIHLTSVDLCQQGANSDANITLYKSVPTQEEKSPVKRAWSFFKDKFSNKGIQKDAQTFGDVENSQEQRRSFYQYQDAFYTSIQSILEDDEQDNPSKRELLLQSISEFNDAMSDWVGALFPDETLEKKKGDNDMNEENMDLSGLSDDEKKTFKGLLGKVKPAAKKEPAKKSVTEQPNNPTSSAPESAPAPVSTDPTPAPTPTPAQPPAPAADPAPTFADPAVQKAIDRMNSLSDRMEKSLKQQEESAMQDVAKKYTPLGEKQEDLVKTLCAMKASGPAAYDAYVGALDKALSAVQKSDSSLFSEIGKSSHQYDAATGSVQKAQEIAKSIHSEHPELTQQQAMARAFEEHPELEVEYEKDYEGGKV